MHRETSNLHCPKIRWHVLLRQNARQCAFTLPFRGEGVVGRFSRTLEELADYAGPRNEGGFESGDNGWEGVGDAESRHIIQKTKAEDLGGADECREVL